MNRNRNFFKNRGELLLENTNNINNQYNINPRVIRDYSCRKPSFNEAQQANEYLTLIKKKMVQTFKKQRNNFENKNNTNYNNPLIQNRINYRKIYRGGTLEKKYNFGVKRNMVKKQILEKEKKILDSLYNLDKNFNKNYQGLKKLQNKNKKIYRNKTFDIKKNTQILSKKTNVNGDFENNRILNSEENNKKKYFVRKNKYYKKKSNFEKRKNFDKENNFQAANYEKKNKKKTNFENQNNYDSKQSNFYKQLDNTMNADEYIKNLNKNKEKGGKKNINKKKKNSNFQKNKKQIKRPVPRRQKLSDKKEENDYFEIPLENLKGANQKIYEEMENLKQEEIYECQKGCGRSFKKSVLEKHEKICKKVFQKKRKKFNSSKQREQAENIKSKKDNKKFLKKKNNRNIKQIPKWKLESAKLRTLLGVARGKDVSNTEEAKIVEESKNKDLIKCKTCNRNFNKKAGERHIPFCEKRARNNTFKIKAKPKKRFKR